jgi:hypothetical protein
MNDPTTCPVPNDPPFPDREWERALRDSDLAPRLKDLARQMKSYADEAGYLRPPILKLRLEHVQDVGNTRLNAPTLLNEKTIDRRVGALVKAGWFRIAMPGGKGKSTVYQMTFPAVQNGTAERDSRRLAVPPRTKDPMPGVLEPFLPSRHKDINPRGFEGWCVGTRWHMGYGLMCWRAVA